MVRYNLSGTYHHVCIPYHSQQNKQIAAGSKCINLVKLRRLSAKENEKKRKNSRSLTSARKTHMKLWGIHAKITLSQKPSSIIEHERLTNKS